MLKELVKNYIEFEDYALNKVKEYEERIEKIAKEYAEKEKKKFIEKYLKEYEEATLCEKCKKGHYEPVYKEQYERVTGFNPELGRYYDTYEYRKERILAYYKCSTCGHIVKTIKSTFYTKEDILEEAERIYGMRMAMKKRELENDVKKMKKQFKEELRKKKKEIVKYLISLPVNEALKIVKEYIPEKEIYVTFDIKEDVENIVREMYKDPDSVDVHSLIDFLILRVSKEIR